MADFNLKPLKVQNNDSDSENEILIKETEEVLNPTIEREWGPQTGPKSVLADYKHKKNLEYQEYQQENQHKRDLMAKFSNRSIPETKTFQAKETKKDVSESTDDSELSGLSDLDSEDERILEEYKNKRILQAEETRINSGIGYLKKVTPVEYTQIVDQYASDDIFVSVMLHLENHPISEKFKSELEKIAKKYTKHRFLQVDSVACGFTDPEVLPILLIYSHGELYANHVKANQDLEKPRHFDQTMIENKFFSSFNI
ncbi:hypothetical protein BB559_001449 [Furculomyces boomerangus]|uniref:Phosducin domain-containing protein n=2 Tax=Harpellales TaxID=61421 RepID=A0A2T9Z1X9_9FUNG|nr:hypothetical protein BB559_001449 [Furculomyces boomerangus]PWA03560.1 hypothetical protein BB558_000244 [Smittium angustum]